MSEIKFSRGPWHCHRNTSFWEFGCDERGQLGDVCASAFTPEGRAPDAEETMEANAHLIAAAPDLYEALECLIRITDDGFSFTPISVAIQLARSALTKARGEKV